MTSLSQFDGKLLDGLEFCSKVYKLFEEIRNSDGGITRFRISKRTVSNESSVEKKLHEELYPICRYVQASYRLGRYISVRWVDGYQSYDAELEQHGEGITQNIYPKKSYLEVTCAMHKNEYLAREILETKGEYSSADDLRRLKNGEIESNAVSYTNNDFIDKDSTLVLDRISKKAKNKHYPENTTLIIPCYLRILYLSNEWDTFINKVKDSLPVNQFKEIYIYDSVCLYSKILYPNRE